MKMSPCATGEARSQILFFGGIHRFPVQQNLGKHGRLTLGEAMEIWGRKIEKPDGTQLAVVGFCGSRKAQQFVARAGRLRTLSFQTEDIIQIDALLAAKLRELFSEGVPAVGASVYLPALSRRALPTGGVLGSPLAEEESSQSELEEIGPSLWLYTQPGGPGWIAAGTRENAESVLRTMKARNLPRWELMDWLMDTLKERCPNGFLIVNDGTGAGSYGFAGAGGENGTLAYTLPRNG